MDCCYVDYTAINNTDVFNIIPKNTNLVKAFLAILNSSLCAYYLKSSNVNLDRNVFPKLNVNTLESFPVPDIKLYKNEILKLTELTEQILKLKKESTEINIQNFETQIDIIVYKLYKISDEEIATIETKQED